MKVPSRSAAPARLASAVVALFVVFAPFSFVVAAEPRHASGVPLELGTGPLPSSADERLDAAVDLSARYRVVLSRPEPVVPSPALPDGLDLGRSNNNLSIALHDGRLFLAFRTAPTHFASAGARLLVLSSPDFGATWAREASFSTGSDLREPFLLEVDGRLLLYFVELGHRMWAFEPRALWRSVHCGASCWTTPERWGGPGEVAWDFKIRGGRAWMTSYQGKHYDIQTQPIAMRFRTSVDGMGWQDVSGGPVYTGGATESSFEFDRDGTLWAVTRNEDGDGTGFGSHVASAPPGRPGAWCFPARSDPARYDSPRLFRHGRDIYLVARRAPGTSPGTWFEDVPGEARKLLIWVRYSLRPKRTALYRLDRGARRFEHVVDLPSAGDTAFPSIVRLSPHEFLVANYSSAFRHAERTWLWGQLNGTGIYFVQLRFVADGETTAPDAAAEEPSGAASPVARAPGAPSFDPDWPGRENLTGRLAGLGAFSLGALVVVRRRRRSLVE
jgi:hypothetical protein